MEIYGVEQLEGDTFPLTYLKINEYLRKEEELVEKLKRTNNHTKYLREGGNIFILIYKNDKIVVPTIIQEYVVNWYYI